MGIFVSGPNDSDRPFKGEDIVLILCDFDIAVEYVCLAANEGNIWIVLLFGIAWVIEDEVFDEWHDVFL